MQQPPYQPKTGLASGPRQPNINQIAQKPVDLFDPNFLKQGGGGLGPSSGGGGYEQLQADRNVVDSIFGAQNSGITAQAPATGPGGADLSHMSERDRRIYLRDLERKNRNQGNTASTYGVADPPPVQSTASNIFGEQQQQPPVASSRRDEIWQQKMAQRSSLPPQLPPPSSGGQPPLSFPSQGQGGFTPAQQLNQPLMPRPPSSSAGMGLAQQPSPNTAHRKFKAIGQSPLRNSNILTSAAAQQSPMRNSLTAQKLQMAKDLDTSIQYNQQQLPPPPQYNSHNPYAQVSSSARAGLPPSGASPATNHGGKSSGLLDKLGNNDQDIQRRNENRALQQNEYNKYLAQQQPPAHQRQRSASGRAIPDVSSSLHSGGHMQMIGGHQMRQQEEKLKMQREYQGMLNDQLQQRTNMHNQQNQLSEARKKQISDQVFNELMMNESHQVRNHFENGAAGNNLHQMLQAQSQLPNINQPSMQQANRPGLPPRVQSAVGANRRDEVQRLQRGDATGEDPFHRNRQNEDAAKRADQEKKREYAAMLQEQMALKKRQKDDQQPSQLPAPDQLFDQQQQQQQQYQYQQRQLHQGGGQYPPGQHVDFGQGPPPPMHQQQQMPQYQPFEPPKYSMNQQVSFEPPQSMMPVSASYNQAPMMGGQFPMGGAPPMPNNVYEPQPQRSHSSHSPRQYANAESSQQNKEAQMVQQRSRQDEYRRELEQQMKLNEEKKRKMKQDQERYDMQNDKDMAQYMKGQNNNNNQQQQPPPVRQVSPGGGGGGMLTGGFGGISQQVMQQQPPTVYGGGPGGGFDQAPMQGVGGGQSQQPPTGIRVASDITKRPEEIDPAKQQAKMRYQEEIKQQMEEAKARKEALKLKEKQADEELERRIQSEQQKLVQKELAEIENDGSQKPQAHQPAKKIINDAFKTSDDVSRGAGQSQQQSYQEPMPSTSMADPPTLAKPDQFMRPEPITPQPLQLPADDNFTLQGPINRPSAHDLFGSQPPQSMLGPDPGFPVQNPLGQGAFGGGPPPPGGGLQSPFNSQLQTNNTQYQQFGGAPPGSAPLSNQQMSTQSDWMANQSHQAQRMFDDQQKMIGMYQQALEQILQYRNQYFEQAMQMRENILKEREQIFEHEKMKQQQVAEMNQLKAVQNQLGTMMGIADQQSVLNPQVTNKLNSYITKQKEQILQMSQSSTSMSKLIRESQFAQQQAQQLHHVPLPQTVPSTPMINNFNNNQGGGELPVTSQRVEIPRQSLPEMPPPRSNPHQVDFTPPQEESNGFDLQKQVEELEAQIAANDIDQQQRALTDQQRLRLSGQYPPLQTQMTSETPTNNMLQGVPASNYGEFQSNPQFEQSLSSESKMVKVPNANLQAMAAQVKRPDILTETWNEQQATKHLEMQGVVISPTREQAVTPTPLQLQDQQRLVTPKRIAGNLIVNPRSPMHQTSMPPTIQELPQEEEKPQNNFDGMRASGFEFQQAHATAGGPFHDEKQSIYDLNNRALSGTSSPPRAQMVSLEAREEMEKIERIVQQQTQSAWVDRRATMTGTSFYDVNRQTQKLQEQTQQEEMQKQLMRILGSTSQSVSASKEDDPLKAMQQAYGPDTERENNAKEDQEHKTQHSSTVKVRASQDKLLKEPSFKAAEEEDAAGEYGQQNNEQFNPLETNKHDTTNQTNNSEINIAATDQSANLRKMQEVAASYGQGLHTIQSQTEEVNMSKGTFQPSELNDQSRITDQVPPSERKQWNKGGSEIPEEKSNQQDPSLWDDPDLVPVPVLPQFSDNSLTYEVQGIEEQDAQGNQNHQRVIPPSANGNQPYYHGASLTQADKTLVGLQQMVPELITTDEFVVQTVHDEVTGEDNVHLSSKNSNQYQVKGGQEVTKKQHFQTYKQSEPMNFDEGASKVAESAIKFDEVQSSVIPTQIGLSNADEAGLKSQHTRKEKEMAEIEDIIRKVTNTAKVTDQKEKELAMKKSLMGGVSQSSWAPQSNKVPPLPIGTPSAPSTTKSGLIAESATTDNQMQTAAPNMAPHRLGQMQRAAEAMEPPQPVPVVNNDQQILSDLDKIIANLEMQQKNMATFGIPQPTNEDPEGEDRQSTAKLQQEEEEEGQKSARSQWTSLSKARDERNKAMAPPPPPGKAPLDPKSRPKSGRSIKSRNASAKGGRSGGADASPQRVGKYAMMALQKQTGDQNASNASPSPQRIGKFAQMAIQNNKDPVVGTEIDNISQKYGRNPSRERLEERSQMSSANGNQSRINNSQIQNGKASPSPQRIGKFTQMALQQQQNASTAEVENISMKYGRNPSRERLEERSMLSQANESRLMNNPQVNNGQSTPGVAQGPILRPVSGKSNNSRYTATTGTAGRPTSNMVNTGQHDQEQNMGFRQTTRTAGQMTTGTAAANANGDRRGSQKIAYYSDEEDDVTAAHGQTVQKGDGRLKQQFQQFSESGKTQQTAHNAQTRFNIADDEDDVNL